MKDKKIDRATKALLNAGKFAKTRTPKRTNQERLGAEVCNADRQARQAND